MEKTTSTDPALFVGATDDVPAVVRRHNLLTEIAELLTDPSALALTDERSQILTACISLLNGMSDEDLTMSRAVLDGFAATASDDDTRDRIDDLFVVVDDIETLLTEGVPAIVDGSATPYSEVGDRGDGHGQQPSA